METSIKSTNQKIMDYEKIIDLNAGVLNTNDGVIETKLYDEELDPIECTFYNDGCIEIDTQDYTHITLSADLLYQMIELIEKAEHEYEKQ